MTLTQKLTENLDKVVKSGEFGVKEWTPNNNVLIKEDSMALKMKFPGEQWPVQLAITQPDKVMERRQVKAVSGASNADVEDAIDPTTF